MKNSFNTDLLLNDLLADTFPPGFRDDLLAGMLREVRNRKRAHYRRQILAVAGLVIAALAPLWILLRPATRIESPPAELSFVIQSRPLDPSLIVRSRLDSVKIVTTSAETVVAIESRPAEELYRDINDDQLMALLAGRSAALVRYGGQAEVIFFDTQE